MKFSKIATICAAVLILGAAPGFAQDAGAPGRGAGSGAAPGGGRGPAGPGLALTTMAFADGGEIPAKYTMAVPNPVSPDLEWSNVPANTVSFVLVLHDAEMALQKKSDDLVHWLVFNIPGSVHELPEGSGTGAALPDGALQGKQKILQILEQHLRDTESRIADLVAFRADLQANIARMRRWIAETEPS